MNEWNQQPINRSIQDTLQNRFDLFCELAPDGEILPTFDEWLDGTGE